MNSLFSFFFNDTATTEIYTLSLHDALPICSERPGVVIHARQQRGERWLRRGEQRLQRPIGAARGRARNLVGDRKSTRLNSSHANISYAVFCLKKKKTTQLITTSSVIVSHLY